MKILFVITGLGVGGAEKLVTSLADRLVEKGHTVKIAYLTGPALTLPSNDSIEIIPIKIRGVQSILLANTRLKRLIKIFRPDVVHSHMFHANLLSRLSRLTIDIPKLVCTAHNTNEGGKARMLAYRLTDKLADISTNVSNQAVEAFVSKGAVKSGRMISVVNGIDTDKYYYDAIARGKTRTQLVDSNKKILLAVGRLDTQKDYPNLLNAISILKIKRNDFKVFIAGNGPLRGELEKRIKILGITEYVELLGICNDIKELMSASDIYVLSSAWEGLPLVMLESMACERIIVSTDCGGVGEAILDKNFLVPVKNPALLAETLQKALEINQEEAVILGKNNRAHIISNYSIDIAVEKWLYLYS